MQFKLSFGMDNAAFDNPGEEPARVLRQIATIVAGFTFSPQCSGVIYPIRDLNGNRIGSFSYEIEDDSEGEI